MNRHKGDSPGDVPRQQAEGNHSDKVEQSPKDAYAEQKRILQEHETSQRVQNVLSEARGKWDGLRNLDPKAQQDIVSHNDLGAAIALGVFGPGFYQMVGRDFAHHLGQSMVEHIGKPLKPVFKPELPESIANLKPNAEAEARAQKETQHLLDQAVSAYGKERVAALHIDKNDLAAAYSLQFISPEQYKAMGHHEAQKIGKQGLIFGPETVMRGLKNEAVDQATKHAGELGVEASGNALLGAAIGGVTALAPEVVVPLAVVGLGALAADPKNQGLISDMWSMANSLDQIQTNTQLLAAADHSRKLLGGATFHSGLVLLTGGAGAKSGETLAHAEAPNLSAMAKQAGDAAKNLVGHANGEPHLRPAFATAGDTTHHPSGNVDIGNTAKMSKVHEHEKPTTHAQPKESAHHADTIENRLMKPIEGKNLTEQQFKDFQRDKGFTGNRGYGTYANKDGSAYLYDKGFVTTSADQAQRNLQVAEHMTECGLFPPSTRWGIYQSGPHEYRLFAVCEALDKYHGKQANLRGSDANRVSPDSDFAKWANGIRDKLGHDSPLLDLINFHEASHISNWGTDKSGHSYPIDFEVLNFGGQGWHIESDGPRTWDVVNAGLKHMQDHRQAKRIK